jgi:hypothetical protein
MEYTEQYLENLRTELDRCCGAGFYNTYKDAKGHLVIGGGESHVKQHLTSRMNYVKGRKFRFPGITNGWNFRPAIETAGYQIVTAINYRGQTCSVVTKK